MIGKRWAAGLSAMARHLVRRSPANKCRPVTAPSERGILLLFLMFWLNE